MSERKRRTITLSGRPPVTIAEDDWPMIASASKHDGQVPSQAFRNWGLYARQHADGRVLVYGVYSTLWKGEHDRRGGELISAGDDIAATIQRVGESVDLPEHLIEECIADLPPEELV